MLLPNCVPSGSAEGQRRLCPAFTVASPAQQSMQPVTKGDFAYLTITIAEATSYIGEFFTTHFL